MNTYQERKNSGVEWLGEIPRHWRREHLKRFAARIQTGVTPPTDTPDYYLDGTVPWFAPGSYDGNLELSEPSKFINEVALHDGAIRMFPAGTVFLIGIGATIGKVGLITEPASCNQQIIGITCNRRMNSRYLAYQLKIYEDVIPGIASGTTLPIFDQVKTGYLPVLQPPLLEQERIAAYLDASCAAIDAAVTAKRGQLETLDALRKDSITRAITRGLNPRIRTKSTGQDWIGEIPEHWSAPCLKRLLREPLTYGLNEAAELEERNLPRYLRITDFDDDGNLRADTFRSLPLEIAREALLEPNDVLFARSGATVGKTFMFRNYDGEACFAGYLIRARTLLWKLDPLFLYLFTKSTAYESWKNLIFTQATIQNISAAKYNYLVIPLPPLSEQRAIIAHVEEKSAEFRSLTSSIESQIATLTAYRKSLIHECVTGQRRISQADVQRAGGCPSASASLQSANQA